jgi:quinol monooxygenase YgiN
MYVRITRFKPIEHWRDEIVKELNSYMEWLKAQPGFTYGLCLFPLHHPDEVARLTVWENRSYADHAATTEHALAVRSDMLGMTMDLAIHEEEFDEQPLYGEGPAVGEEQAPSAKPIDRAPSHVPDPREQQTILRGIDLL